MLHTSDIDGAHVTFPAAVEFTDGDGRRFTQHFFPPAAVVAADQARRASESSGRDPFAALPAVDDEEW